MHKRSSAVRRAINNTQSPDPPVFDYADDDGYVYWQTYLEYDLGPNPLPPDDEYANYDACNADNCYVDDDVGEENQGDVMSDYSGFCYVPE